MMDREKTPRPARPTAHRSRLTVLLRSDVSRTAPIRLPKRLLIANRGEIAIRVARTAREMDIETIGVYAEGDAGAAHLAHVDGAESLGPGGPAETYLSADRLLAA